MLSCRNLLYFKVRFILRPYFPSTGFHMEKVCGLFTGDDRDSEPFFGLLHIPEDLYLKFQTFTRGIGLIHPGYPEIQVSGQNQCGLPPFS